MANSLNVYRISLNHIIIIIGVMCEYVCYGSLCDWYILLLFLFSFLDHSVRVILILLSPLLT